MPVTVYFGWSFDEEHDKSLIFKNLAKLLEPYECDCDYCENRIQDGECEFPWDIVYDSEDELNIILKTFNLAITGFASNSDRAIYFWKHHTTNHCNCVAFGVPYPKITDEEIKTATDFMKKIGFTKEPLMYMEYEE